MVIRLTRIFCLSPVLTDISFILFRQRDNQPNSITPTHLTTISSNVSSVTGKRTRSAPVTQLRMNNEGNLSLGTVGKK